MCNDQLHIRTQHNTLRKVALNRTQHPPKGVPFFRKKRYAFTPIGHFVPGLMVGRTRGSCGGGTKGATPEALASLFFQIPSAHNTLSRTRFRPCTSTVTTFAKVPALKANRSLIVVLAREPTAAPHTHHPCVLPPGRLQPPASCN